MKEREKVKSGKYLRIMAIGIVILIAVAVGLTIKAIADSKKEFYQDGYILVPSLEKMVTTNVNEQYYFTEGTTYQNKLGEKIVFTDTTDKKVSIDATQFVHYLDGALGAFSKGVVLDLADVGQEQVKYYGVSDKTIITKSGISYSMSYLGKSMNLNEFIWKISDDSYMVVSPQVTLHLNNATDVVLDDYVQVQYVAGGIARLVHKDGTYQTVADDAYLRTDSGLELRLTSRCFYKNGEQSVSLDSMVIDASSNLKVDENEDKVKLPVFNVVNGKDGADGSDGNNGGNGDHGYEGATGGKGGEGSDGNEGQNGLDGVEGDGGDWGYDGKDGLAGEDAENDGASDGIASIDQLQAPRVLIENESYLLGPNSVMMNVAIDDKHGMLDEDPKWVIYNRDNMSICGEGTIPRGSTGQVITTNSLTPDTEYVLVVSGDYTNDGYSYSADLLTKIFKTDSIGITIEKVKVTEDSIIVKTVMDSESKIGTYKIALFVGEDSNTNVSTYLVEYVGGREFVFNKEMGVADGVEITSDTKYRIGLYDVKESTIGSLVSTDIQMEVKTLKETPHYEIEEDDEVTIIPIANKLTKAITSSRYKSVAISLDDAIVDNDNGIVGYRYELFEASSMVGNINDAVPSQVKEVEEMQTVNFGINAETNYIARVVVLFNDNEKIVEIAANQTGVFKLEQSTYPSVSFVNVVHEYDAVSGYVMVEDNSNDHEMLLNHIGSDYPLVLTIAAKVGDPVTINLYNPVNPPQGSNVSDNIKYYYFSQDGLNRNTPYSMTVSGYVNETGKEWMTLVNSGTEKNCFQYIAGSNFNSGNPTEFIISAQSLQDTGSNLFAITLGFTAGLDGSGNPIDASYEVANLEKLSFSLVNKHTGVVLGNYATVKDSDMDDMGYEAKHDSVFVREAYVANGQPAKYSNNIVLTDASFDVEGDSRIAAGGVFQIRLEGAYDYTQRDSYTEYTNELDVAEESYMATGNKVIFEFTVEQRHVQVSDPNNAVTITPIQNQDALSINDKLNPDTVVGLKIDSGYTVDDAHQIIYYIYEVTSANGEPVIKDKGTTPGSKADPLTKNTWVDQAGNTYEPKAVKIVDVTAAASEGDYVTPWIVYFDNQAGEYSNVVDGQTIFERGKMYFVRYEIVTNGRLEDTSEGDKYPDCVYERIYSDKNNYPFYRSNVFGLKRQEPTLQRYLWDTSTDNNDISSHIWKYKIYDPDGAILEYADSIANANMFINHYADFETATSNADPVNKNAALELRTAKLTSLYGTGNVFKEEYGEVTVGNLPKDKWYTLSIPYSIYNKNTRSEYLKDEEGNAIENNKNIVSRPMEIKAVSDINTNILHDADGIDDPKHPTDSKDYFVEGVMVKGAKVEEMGLTDDYGYRIKIALAGSELHRVAALRVTVTGKVNENDVTVIYDPVDVTMASSTYGTKDNIVAFAYLEYEPIVKAGLNNKAVTVKVEAYYTTYQSGFSSFTGYTPTVHVNAFTTEGFRFTSGNAWAIKQYTYKNDNGILNYDYRYQRIVDNMGKFTACPQVKLDDSSDILTNTLSGSVFIPSGAGFVPAIDETRSDILNFFYTVGPMCYTTMGDSSFADIKKYKSFNLNMDEVGASGSDGMYYTLEKMNLATLQIDGGKESEDYKIADFIAGDGMPGIEWSDANSSAGMTSIFASFNIKGALPGTDKGYYIYLYDSLGNKLGLDKYEDADGKIYYLLEGSSPSSTGDIKLATADDGSDAVYGTVADGQRVDFAIRGLESGTTYNIRIMAKNRLGTMQYLFDYAKETGGVEYSKTTTTAVIINAADIVFKYNKYNNKYGAINYGIEGSEGTGMRIFYKVYDSNSNEVDCGLQNKTALGYQLVPKGNNIKYYHSDLTQCNPATINFNPGALQMGAAYTVVFKAYQSDNDGNILDSSKHIGYAEVDFTTETLLDEPTASMQITAGRDNIEVTGAVTDKERTIMGDKYTIAVYDLEGNMIPGQEVTNTMAAGVTKVSFAHTFTGLDADSMYIVKVTADVDTNNDGTADGIYEYALTANTISTASATVIMSYTVNDELIISLENATNFNDVKYIRYTIDSSDGSTNFTNGYLDINMWNSIGVGNYSYITGFELEEGQYRYSLQYYDASNRLVGSNTGRFDK